MLYDLSLNMFGMKPEEEGLHHVRIQSHSQDAPLRYYSICSCRWIGVTIEEYFPEQKSMLIPPLVPFVEMYGLNALLDPRTAVGTYEDSVVGVLHHIGYDPEFDVSERTEKLEQAREDLSLNLPDRSMESHGYMSAKSSAESLSSRLDETASAVRRREIFKEREPLTDQHDPELYLMKEQILRSYWNPQGTAPF